MTYLCEALPCSMCGKVLRRLPREKVSPEVKAREDFEGILEERGYKDGYFDGDKNIYCALCWDSGFRMKEEG